MIDPKIVYWHRDAQQEWTITDLRSQLLGLQQAFDVDDPAPFGAFWRAKTRRLEEEHYVAGLVVRGKAPIEDLAAAHEAVEAVAPPACRDGDHAKAA